METTSAISHADTAALVMITFPSDSSIHLLKSQSPQTNHWPKRAVIPPPRPRAMKRTP